MRGTVKQSDLRFHLGKKVGKKEDGEVDAEQMRGSRDERMFQVKVKQKGKRGGREEEDGQIQKTTGSYDVLSDFDRPHRSDSNTYL